MTTKVIIIGGAAGGANTATRLRRLREDIEIILVERGEHVSYASCGLPYYIGEVIKDRKMLFAMDPKKFKDWFNVDVRLNCEAISLDRDKQKVKIKNQLTSETYWENYDYLVLSPGAEPIRPPLPGIDNPLIFSLRNVSDTDHLYSFIDNNKPNSAVIIGGGFIGLEMVENIKSRGIEVTLVELAPQVLPLVDPEIAAFVQQNLRNHEISLYLGDGVAGFKKNGKRKIEVILQSEKILEADFVLLSIGVKPEVELARKAGLKVGKGIIVNEHLQTSDSRIYALGDAIEVVDFVTGTAEVIPLAGPANKQGRIVANNIAGRQEVYRGTQRTSVLKVFDQVVASTGVNERFLKQAKLEYRYCIIHPESHAGYYPGSNPIVLKLLFSPKGAIYGAQAIGYGGVDKRIDVIAASMRLQKNIYDLQGLELAYAPPFSSAKDPVNIAGFVAGNILQGDINMINSNELMYLNRENIQILDLRERLEYELWHIPGAVSIPFEQLRQRIDEVSTDKDIVLYCYAGLFSYMAARILMQRGFTRVRSLNGGCLIYMAMENEMLKKGDIR